MARNGETIYEGPNDVHTTGRSASATEPAKLVALLVKDIGAEALLPAE